VKAPPTFSVSRKQQGQNPERKQPVANRFSEIRGGGGRGGGVVDSFSLKTVASRHKYGSSSKNKLFSGSLGDLFFGKRNLKHIT